MKKYFSNDTHKIFLSFFLIGITGFILGICAVNTIYRQMNIPWNSLGIYFINVKSPEYDMMAFFLGTLTEHLYLLLLAGILSFIAIGLIVIILYMLWHSFLLGCLMTMFFTEYGIKGILLGAGCLLPQYLFYIAGIYLLYSCSWTMGVCHYKKRKITGRDYREHFLGIVGVLGMMMIGSLMEYYVNYHVVIWMKNIFL